MYSLLNVSAVHRVHNNVPARMGRVHRGICMHHMLYFLHDTNGVSVISVLCAVWLMLLLMKQMVPTGRSTAVQGDFCFACANIQCIHADMFFIYHLLLSVFYFLLEQCAFLPYLLQCNLLKFKLNITALPTCWIYLIFQNKSLQFDQYKCTKWPFGSIFFPIYAIHLHFMWPNDWSHKQITLSVMGLSERLTC